MSAPASPDPATYRIPSLARRLVVGVAIAALVLVFVGVVPYEILTRLSAAGLATALPAQAVILGGLAFAAFAAARHIAKPTRAFGPVTIAGAAFSIGYLLFISQRATIAFSTHDTTVTLAYGSVFVLLVVVPLLRLASGAFTTIEDARHPGERLPFDYPV